jgi:hypothetical protein
MPEMRRGLPAISAEADDRHDEPPDSIRTILARLELCAQPSLPVSHALRALSLPMSVSTFVH